MANLIPKFMAAGKVGGIVIVILSMSMMIIYHAEASSLNYIDKFTFQMSYGNNIIKPNIVIKPRISKKCIL